MSHVVKSLLLYVYRQSVCLRTVCIPLYVVGLVDWVVNWLDFFVCLIDSLRTFFDWPVSHSCLVGCLVAWLLGCLIKWLTDWLWIHWIFDGLVDWLMIGWLLGCWVSWLDHGGMVVFCIDWYLVDSDDNDLRCRTCATDAWHYDTLTVETAAISSWTSATTVGTPKQS